MNRKVIFSTSIVSVVIIAFTLMSGGSVTAFSCDTDYVTQSDDVFIVEPTGVDDTENIQCAFDEAVSTGSGTTVQLSEGIFYISRDIVVVNFDGSFKGAGKDLTVVENLDDDLFPLHGPTQFQHYPGLFLFYQDANSVPSSLSFSDMTIRAKGKSVEWSAHGLGPFESMNILEVYGKYTGVEDFEPSYINTSYERMGFEGESIDNPYWGSNVLNAIEFGGEPIYQMIGGSIDLWYVKPVIGDHMVKECYFGNVVSGISTPLLLDSTLEVTSNIFDDGLIAFGISDPGNSEVEITNNVITHIMWFGVEIEQSRQATIGWDLGPFGDLPEPSNVLVSHNIIHAIAIADGIGLIDYAPLFGESSRLNSVISHNTIILDNTDWGGIWGFGAQDVHVRNNIIFGTGLSGIYFGVYDDPTSGWLILGNNVQNVDAFVAPILLGPGTNQNTVVGGSNQTNVLDFGTDNVVVGVNNMPGNPPGPEIQDAMRQKLEQFNLMR